MRDGYYEHTYMSKDDSIEVDGSFFYTSVHPTEYNSNDLNSTNSYPKRQFEQAFELTYLFLKNGHSGSNSPLREGSATFDATLDAGEIAVVSVDLRGRVLLFNRRFVSLWNMSPGILATQKYAQYVAYCRQQLKEPASFEQNELTLKDGRRLYQASRQQKIDSETVVFTRVYQAVGRPEHPVGRGVRGYAEDLYSDVVHKDDESENDIGEDDKSLQVREVISIEQYLTERRLQRLSKVAHRSVDVLNLVSLATNLVQTYGSSLSFAKKQSYTQKTSDAIDQLSELLQETERINQLSLSRLDFATLGWPINSAHSSKTQLCQHPCNVCKMCHAVVDKVRSQYRRHAFVVFSMSRQSVVCTNSLVLRLVISHVVGMLSQYAQMGLIKVVVLEQANYLVLRFFENSTILLIGDEGRLPRIQSFSSTPTASAPTPDRKLFESEMLLIETLLEMLGGLISIEKGQNGTVVTLSLPFSMDSNIAV